MDFEETETWSTRHEYEGLMRYRRTHLLNDFQYHPIDSNWFETELEQVRLLINNDPIRPTEEQYIQIERKHTYWRKGTF